MSDRTLTWRRTYHQCPQCCRKGVYVKNGRHADDCYICRYCQWSLYLVPETEEEKKELAAFELSIRVARFQSLSDAYEAGFKAGREASGAEPVSHILEDYTV